MDSNAKATHFVALQIVGQKQDRCFGSMPGQRGFTWSAVTAALYSASFLSLSLLSSRICTYVLL